MLHMFHVYLLLNLVSVNGMGAGICPISKYRNKIYVLLGKERFNDNWSDFGGSRDGNETPFNTAVREGYEELDGFFGTKKEFKNIVITNFIEKIDNGKNYYSYLTKFEFDKNLPFYFNNHHKFVENKTKNLCGKNGLYEKSEIRWFTIEELKTLENIRPHYSMIISTIILMSEDLLYIL